MNNVKQGDSYSFLMTMKRGLQLVGHTDLLGRDIRYVLNVKTVADDGSALAGKTYTLNSTHGSANKINIPKVGMEMVSTADGNDFLIYGKPAESEGDYNLMQCEFTLSCDSGSGQPSEQLTFKMGRLAYWGAPRILASDDVKNVIFKTKTEWAGEGTPGALWGWGDNVEDCTIKFPTLNIEVESPTQTGSDGSASVELPVELGKFSTAPDVAPVEILAKVSKSGYTAISRYYEERELYYFASVKFTAPPVYVGVAAEVTCVLIGLNGKPRAGEMVSWSASKGAMLDATSVTDANGIAASRFLTDEIVDVTITATAERMRLNGSSQLVIIQPLEIISHQASATQSVVGISPPIKFSVWVGGAGTMFSGVKVDWLYDGRPMVVDYSDAAGRSDYDVAIDVGEHKVTARLTSSQVSVDFLVTGYTVAIGEVSGGSSNYIVGLSAPEVFSLKFVGGAQPVPGIRVDWYLAGVKLGDSVSGEDGKATFSHSFEAGTHEITPLVLGHPELRHSFRVEAYPLVVARQEASATQYLVGSSETIEFSVWLTANNKPVVCGDVQWAIDGAPQRESSLDIEGKATIDLTFDEGEHVVTASIANHNSLATFNIVSLALGFDVVITPARIRDPDAPDLLCRGVEYYLDVLIVDEQKKPVPGIPFRMSSSGDDLESNAIEIYKLNTEQVSGANPVRYLTSKEWSIPTNFTLALAADQRVFEWRRHYRMGWIYLPLRVDASITGRRISAFWTNSTLLSHYSGEPLDFGPIEVSNGDPVVLQGKVTRLSLPVAGHVFSSDDSTRSDASPLEEVDVAGKFTFSRKVLLDGFMVFVAGEAVGHIVP
ncbi:Ig-like domain-containing protein [Pseudomonas sp. GD03842]|uniref:Ig-like domain-containing protein n=1 Tax=Pseudomonas sp. GD03842 TaxID=2975385 RepID=UPI0024489FF5|nr:Ig-like domain-containing protein [Pseudomonas sp. GD03842]MDH0746735.1 Ig-like domain-containing protein [Pseudomonas sp. GD03842]